MAREDSARASDYPDEVHPIVAFRDHLLRQTFEWCVSRSPYYRDRFSKVQSFSGLSDLYKLPILRRDDVVQNRETLSCEPGPPAYFQFTTGTTGTFLPLYRSAAEVAFISRFYGERLAEEVDVSASRPLCLKLASAYHGASAPMPSASYVVRAGVYDRSQAETARNLLSRTYDFPGVESRVSMLVGFDILVRALTAYLMDTGIHPSSLGVRRIFITGGYVPPAAKRRLGELWNASIHDRLSMSEIFGGARETFPGGPWIFDVEVVPEVVHPRTLEPIRKGIGLLLMTTLYPFSQMSPMIRYDTGDLVEVLDESSALDSNLIVQFKGRRRRSVIDVTGPEVEPLVLCTDLADFLEDLPDVAITPHFAYIRNLGAREYAGKPHCEVSVADGPDGPESIIIALGLRYAPWLFPERVAEIEATLRSHLFESSPNFARRVEQGRLVFRIETRTADSVAPFSTE